MTTRARTPEELAALRESATKLSVTCFKGGIPGYYEWIGRNERIQAAVAAIQRLREGLGDAIDIGIDFHAKTSPSMASIICREVEPLNLMFIEEPCPPENYRAMARIARRTTTPIATGERLVTHYAVQQLLEDGAVDILQTDINYVGGITALWKVGAMAEASGVLMAPHACEGPIGGIATLHIDAAIGNVGPSRRPGWYQIPAASTITASVRGPQTCARRYVSIHGRGRGVDTRTNVQRRRFVGTTVCGLIAYGLVAFARCCGSIIRRAPVCDRPQPGGLVMRSLVFVVIIGGVLIPIGAVWSQPVSNPRANPALRPVEVPPDNPQTEAKVALGAQLFFEPRLSRDNTISCATCHDPQLAWANHNAVDVGIDGRRGTRNSGTILDAAYMDVQFWDGRARTLEEQALGPIHNPVEMGETVENVVKKLAAIDGYRTQFRAVFGSEVTADAIAKAIAAFERTVLSGPSPYDKYTAGDKSAMPEAAVRGLRLFNGKARCRMCHGGPMFSDQGFHNIGVGMDRPQPDIGREAVTKAARDRGRFKTPGLRNVALTWPYMHDGSVRTLIEAVEFYDRGGVKNPTLDIFVMPLDLTGDDRRDLVAFLEALTGSLPKIDRPVLPK